MLANNGGSLFIRTLSFYREKRKGEHAPKTNSGTMKATIIPIAIYLRAFKCFFIRRNSIIANKISTIEIAIPFEILDKPVSKPIA